MNNKHTPGKLRVQRPRGPQHAIDRKFELVVPLDRGEQVIVGEHTGIDCLTAANADRLAMCWNMHDDLVAIARRLDAWRDDEHHCHATVAMDILRHEARAVLARLEGGERRNPRTTVEETLPCSKCGRSFAVDLLDAKDDGTGNFTILECRLCYGPGWSPALEHQR